MGKSAPSKSPATISTLRLNAFVGKDGGTSNIDLARFNSWAAEVSAAVPAAATFGGSSAHTLRSRLTLEEIASGFTEGSVIFAGPGGGLAQDNINFFWNNTDKRLKLGTSPADRGVVTARDDTDAEAAFVGTRSSTGLATISELYNPDTSNGNGVDLLASGDTTGVGAAVGQAFARIRGVFTIHDHATRIGSWHFATANGGLPAVRVRLGDSGLDGLEFGSAFDTNIYRSAPNTLKTDDDFVIGTMTAGSVLFAGTSGLVSQDNANLFWNNTTDNFLIRLNSPTDTDHAFEVSGPVFLQGPAISGGNFASGSQSGSLFFNNSGGQPEFVMRRGDAAVDNKQWDVILTTTEQQFRLLNDSITNATIWLQVERSSMTVTDVSFPNGNVGIGTAAPATNLDVFKSGTGNAILLVGTAFHGGAGNGNAKIQAAATSGDLAYLQLTEEGIKDWSIGIRTGTGGDLVFHDSGDLTGGTDYLVIDNAGNVGLNDTSPSTRLSLGGTGISNGITLGDDAADPVNIYRGAANRMDTDDAFKLASFVFASLPTAATGALAVVTNSTTATWGATIAGGGANTVLAFYNGTNWTVAGA